MDSAEIIFQWQFDISRKNIWILLGQKAKNKALDFGDGIIRGIGTAVYKHLLVQASSSTGVPSRQLRQHASPFGKREHRSQHGALQNDGVPNPTAPNPGVFGNCMGFTTEKELITLNFRKSPITTNVMSVGHCFPKPFPCSPAVLYKFHQTGRRDIKQRLTNMNFGQILTWSLPRISAN